ncbi:globin [Humidisolicoccus flavus]|uniref:globin n=1 Tax=Humidisolicoccus flavus TaxID=3111414 RepID=UPI003254E451
MTHSTFYYSVGGREKFKILVDVFYDGVAGDPVLRPMYPEEDLTGAKERFLTFLEQYWGGPTTYSEQRGHPRLRMRHMPFQIDAVARDRWLFHVRRGVEAAQFSPLHEAELLDYLDRAAHAMVNFNPAMHAEPSSGPILASGDQNSPTS